MCSFLFHLGNRRLDWLAAIIPSNRKRRRTYGQAKRAVEFERLNSDSPWEDCFLTVAVCVGGLGRGRLGSWWIAINKMPRPH